MSSSTPISFSPFYTMFILTLETKKVTKIKGRRRKSHKNCHTTTATTRNFHSIKPFSIKITIRCQWLCGVSLKWVHGWVKVDRREEHENLLQFSYHGCQRRKRANLKANDEEEQHRSVGWSLQNKKKSEREGKRWKKATLNPGGNVSRKLETEKNVKFLYLLTNKTKSLQLERIQSGRFYQHPSITNEKKLNQLGVEIESLTVSRHPTWIIK